MADNNVFIAESVSPADFYDGLTGGRAAQEVVRLLQSERNRYDMS